MSAVPVTEIRRCTRCVLPSTFPGVSFDADGLCSMCQEAPPAPEFDKIRGNLRRKLEEVFAAHRGKAEYDVIVAFSGGKDSSYTLMTLARTYGLKCLAVTIDNGFIAEQAQKNLRVVTASLGIDFLLFTPAPVFMNDLYKTSATTAVHTKAALTRASSMCNSCINLINNHMVKLALEKSVPIIAGGYIGGQVPKDSVLMVMDLDVQARFRSEAIKRYVKHFGPDAASYFGISDALVARSPLRKINIVNPMLAFGVTEDRIIEEIATLGWRKTSDTGSNSTNCLLNDLGIAVHYKQHGYNPYVNEIAEQVRTGLMSRAEALEKVQDIPDFARVERQARKIGLDWNEV
ncbi:MAG: hypothetical protein B6D46_01245 [Polyangiaceae bacterium UTPRO1]|jgi:hypothetical protein|nr:hypothetical protein [Myxococcales bacterium]OQY69145.1 MAG: hypothetical protein B6D46_01245 [Polyangiaceae bacterium UTPRO1]